MKHYALAALLPVLGGCGLAAQENSQWGEAFGQRNTEVLAHSEAYTRLGESIENIGHRLTGSLNGAKAEQYVFDLFKSYGFTDVSFQPFSVNGWARESLDLQAGPPGQLSPLKAVAL